MELTLRYAGKLHSAAGANRVFEKHRVRKYLSEQLERYWEQDRRLDSMYAKWRGLQIPSQKGGRFVVPRPLKDGTKFWWRFPLEGYNFIPLLTHIHGATCALDIRMYRRVGDDGVLYQGGDIDNRLKIFLDALQVPHQADQTIVNQGQSDNPEDWPAMFCLVDDDRTITKLSITSLKLLTDVPEDCGGDENYLELDVDITITPTIPMFGTMMLSNP